jgi:GWxTD domain-containing protein
MTLKNLSASSAFLNDLRAVPGKNRVFPLEGEMKFRRSLAFGLVVLWAVAGAAKALPSKDHWYAQHYFLLQDYERKAYKALSANGRRAFQKLYWESRSQAAKEEFDRRMVFIAQNYKSENSSQPWNTERARIYLLNGRPAGIDLRQNNDWVGSVAFSGGAAGVTQDRSNEDIQANTLEVWSYSYGKYVVMYGFTFQAPNKWRQAQISAAGGRYLEGLEKQNRTQVWGPTDEEAYKARLDELKTIR